MLVDSGVVVHKYGGSLAKKGCFFLFWSFSIQETYPALTLVSC
jgi:hypothetical protein